MKPKKRIYLTEEERTEVERLVADEMAKIEVVEDIDWKTLDQSAMYFKASG